MTYDERYLLADEVARYIIRTGFTVRKAASNFNLPKSTVHSLMTNFLKMQNYQLFCKVRDVLDFNKSQRHIRGGEATRRKYTGK